MVGITKQFMTLCPIFTNLTFLINGQGPINRQGRNMQKETNKNGSLRDLYNDFAYENHINSIFFPKIIDGIF